MSFRLFDVSFGRNKSFGIGCLCTRKRCHSPLMLNVYIFIVCRVNARYDSCNFCENEKISNKTETDASWSPRRFPSVLACIWLSQRYIYWFIGLLYTIMTKSSTAIWMQTFWIRPLEPLDCASAELSNYYWRARPLDFVLLLISASCRLATYLYYIYRTDCPQYSRTVAMLCKVKSARVLTEIGNCNTSTKSHKTQLKLVRIV